MRLGSNQDGCEYGAFLGPKHRTGWFSIWVPELTHRDCLPPRDSVLIIRGGTLNIRYQYLPTVADVDAPQQGVENEFDADWLMGSCALKDDDKAALAVAEADAIELGQHHSHLHLLSHFETKRRADDYDWNNEIWDEIISELWLSLKGWLAQCPYCVIRDEWISPIREGRFICCRPRCWRIIPWRNADGVEAIGVAGVQRANDALAVAHSTARTNARHISVGQIAIWRNYVATWRNTDRHLLRCQRRWLWGRPARDRSGIPYFLCRASAGVDPQRARPYVLPPWEPQLQWSKPQWSWGNFPPGFDVKFKDLVQGRPTEDFALRSATYYMLVWACVRVCIKRDAGLWQRPAIRQYFHDVIQTGQWWMKRNGWDMKGWSPRCSFLAIGLASRMRQLDDDDDDDEPPRRNQPGWDQGELERPENLSEQFGDEDNRGRQGRARTTNIDRESASKPDIKRTGPSRASSSAPAVRRS
jgi:hypothetical protein